MPFIADCYEVLSYPIHKINSRFEAIKNSIVALSTAEELIERNKVLEEEVVSLKAISAENEKLKMLLHYKDGSKKNYITTRLIYNSQDFSHSKLWIGVGKNVNIKKGNPVINKDGLVGRVTEVYEKHSIVLPVSSVISKVPAFFLQSGRKCVVVGTGELNSNLLKILHIEKSDVDIKSIAHGETVVTSGEGGIFDYGIKIGKVFYNQAGELLVKSEVNFNDMNFVRVVTGE